MMAQRELFRHCIKHGLAYSFACCIVLLAALHIFALPKVTERTVYRTPNEKPYPIVFPHQMPDFWNPWRVPDNAPAIYHYEIKLEYHMPQQTKFLIYPTGCVEGIIVNGLESRAPRHDTCNRDAGFEVDLQDDLRPGTNTIEIYLNTHRFFHGSRPYDTATYGLHFGPKFFGAPGLVGLSDILCTLALASACLMFVFLMRRLSGEWGSGVILAAGFLIFMRQVDVTSYMQYVIDMPSHFEYICFIARNGFPPKPIEGWEYYHPAFYYTIAADIVLMCNWLGSFDALTTIRVFSVLCFMVFLIFSSLALRRMIRNNIAFYASLLMLVMYPSGVFNAVRLDSHLLYYSFAGGCMYYIVCWLQDNRIRYLWLSLICFGFAIACRSNALSLAPMIGLAGLFQLYRRQVKLRYLFSIGMMVSLAAIAFGVTQNFGRTAHFHQVDHNNMPYVVGNIYTIQSTQYIQTSLEHMLMLNTQMLFNTPFTDWWHDSTGRQYFWNGMLKTSLFEHFWWHDVGAAKRLLDLLLSAVGFILVSLFITQLKKRKEFFMCGVSLAFFIGSLMANRYYHPYAPSQDFRYIYPSLLGFCALLGLIVEQNLNRRQYVRAVIGIGIMLWFSWTSIVMIRAG